MVSRSGAGRDNAHHRAFFTLPPIRSSTETLPSVPELPPQQRVTGDKEVDAVLWLHSVIKTGQTAMIDLAMQAAKKIKTPLDVLEKRYRDFIVMTNPGNPFAALSSFGFGDLERLAESSTRARGLHLEAYARFDDPLAETEPDMFCITGLQSLERAGKFGDFDKAEVAERFKAHPDLMPNTLADCLHELGYWNQLYLLRNAVDRDASDGWAESTARDWFVFGLLAEIRPRNKTEALAVFRYLVSSERDDMAESEAILCNLIG
ncbi:hypothetical protein KGD89_04230 [Pseudomonas cichorii]|nr:hypothetical protein KGD89_04230 [Pseudomonas cichorii]